jgi:hypothetical protein
MNTSTPLRELWNYCNVLRDDGMSYGDYVEQPGGLPCGRTGGSCRSGTSVTSISDIAIISIVG